MGSCRYDLFPSSFCRGGMDLLFSSIIDLVHRGEVSREIHSPEDEEMTMISVSNEDIAERCYAIISIIDKKRAELDEIDAQQFYINHQQGFFKSKPVTIEVCRRMAKGNNDHVSGLQYDLCKTLIHAIENGRKIVAISATDYRMIFQ
jgi:hypothetical protein